MPRGMYERAKDGRHGTTASPAYLLFPIGERWRAAAACLDHPDIPPAFFDDTLGDDEHRETRKERAERMERAKAVCRNECPVRDACLAAVDLDWDDGARGGIDLREIRTCKQCRPWLRLPFPEVVALHRRHGVSAVAS